MEKLEVIGGKKLKGNIKISGSKNSSLPILAATLLSNKKVKILNLPKVKGIETMLLLLRSLGSKIKLNKKNKSVDIDNSKNINIFASYNLVKTMRAGILVLGPLLARFGQAKVSLPGGCAIGSRPIDLHLDALKKMGASIKIKDGYILASAKKGLKGCFIKFPKISVGATENLIIAASLAKGKTILKNCAIEPEIGDLINFLRKMGCNIKWTGKRTVTIIGVKKLKEAKYKIMFDRVSLIQIVIKKIEAKVYLEIGVFKGYSFLKTICKNKIGIDPCFKIKKIKKNKNLIKQVNSSIVFRNKFS